MGAQKSHVSDFKIHPGKTCLGTTHRDLTGRTESSARCMKRCREDHSCVGFVRVKDGVHSGKCFFQWGWALNLEDGLDLKVSNRHTGDRDIVAADVRRDCYAYNRNWNTVVLAPEMPSRDCLDTR